MASGKVVAEVEIRFIETRALDTWIEDAPDRCFIVRRSQDKLNRPNWIASCAIIFGGAVAPVPGMGAHGQTKAEAIAQLDAHILSDAARMLGAS